MSKKLQMRKLQASNLETSLGAVSFSRRKHWITLSFYVQMPVDLGKKRDLSW